jgi:hypothetical protein
LMNPEHAEEIVDSVIGMTYRQEIPWGCSHKYQIPACTLA